MTAPSVQRTSDYDYDSYAQDEVYSGEEGEGFENTGDETPRPLSDEGEVSGRYRNMERGRVEASDESDSDRLQYLNEVTGSPDDENNTEDVQAEIKNAEDDFKQSLEELTQLEPQAREKLLKEFQEKAKPLSHAKNGEKARSELEKLSTQMNRKARETLKTYLNQVKQDKEANLDIAIQAMDYVVSRTCNDNIGGWWGADVTDRLAPQLKAYFQGIKASLESGGTLPGTSDISSQISGINKDEINDAIQYITGAIYEKCGKDEAKLYEVMRTCFGDQMLGTISSRILEETGRIDDTGGGGGNLKYFSAGQISGKLQELKGRTDLQYLNPDNAQQYIPDQNADEEN